MQSIAISKDVFSEKMRSSGLHCLEAARHPDHLQWFHDQCKDSGRVRILVLESIHCKGELQLGHHL